MPDGYGLRALQPGEFDAVADVVIADELGSTGQITLGADFVRGEWSHPGFDLATDAWAVVSPAGRIVGYGQAKLEDPETVVSWGCVHPEHKGRGLGTALFERIEQHGSTLLAGQPSGRLRHAIYAGDRGAAAILQVHGLRPVRYFWHMQIDLATPLLPTPVPDGVEIRGLPDVKVVYGVINAALMDNWDYQPAPFDQWLEELAGAPGHDPTLWLLATSAGEPVGALTASVAQDRGWVDYLGVLAPHRGRGIAGALLHRCLTSLADRGLRRALVSVDAHNATGATEVFERAGMRVVKGWQMWERPATRAAANPDPEAMSGGPKDRRPRVLRLLTEDVEADAYDRHRARSRRLSLPEPGDSPRRQPRRTGQDE